MATRRMFSLKIVDTDAFLEMPMSSQLLYLHLSMRADDEGFVGSPKRIMRLIGVNEDDLKVLTSKRFILSFKSGIVVIKHWLIHNVIRMDRLQKTLYQKEKETLILNEYDAYTEDCQPNVNQTATKCPPKLSKVKLSKDNIAFTQSKRSTTNFLKEDYNQIIKKYEELKGISFFGTEYLPIQQTIKSMFMDNRKKEDIIALMEFLNKSSLEHWQNWNINTIKKQIPLFIGGKLTF